MACVPRARAGTEGGGVGRVCTVQALESPPVLPAGNQNRKAGIAGQQARRGRLVFSVCWYVLAPVRARGLLLAIALIAPLPPVLYLLTGARPGRCTHPPRSRCPARSSPPHHGWHHGSRSPAGLCGAAGKPNGCSRPPPGLGRAAAGSPAAPAAAVRHPPNGALCLRWGATSLPPSQLGSSPSPPTHITPFVLVCSLQLFLLRQICIHPISTAAVCDLTKASFRYYPQPDQHPCNLADPLAVLSAPHTAPALALLLPPHTLVLQGCAHGCRRALHCELRL